jgi:hypothetical protein
LPAERRVLLDFTAGITNWVEVQAARRLRGWTDCAPATPEGCNVCLWSGVSCVDVQPVDGGQTGTIVTSL